MWGLMGVIKGLELPVMLGFRNTLALVHTFLLRLKNKNNLGILQGLNKQGWYLILCSVFVSGNCLLEYETKNVLAMIRHSSIFRYIIQLVFSERT